MNRTEWKTLYINKLIQQGLTHKKAEETYLAGNHDFNDCPIDQAIDECSYND